MSPHLEKPSYPDTMPTDAHRLGGVGAGSWFHIEKTDQEDQFRIRRYSPTGTEECDRIFQVESGKTVDMEKPLSFTYISHCALCTILQDDQEIVLEWVK